MADTRSDVEDRLVDLLRTARSSLGLSVSFVSRLDETTQHLEVVESEVPTPFRAGQSRLRRNSPCQAILDGALPSVIPDTAALPADQQFPVPSIRSLVSVPIVLSDGSLYGTFCAAGFSSEPSLTARDKTLMDVLAQAASAIIEPTVHERARRSAIEDRLLPVIEAGGPIVVLQPIVDFATGRFVGAEALSRFPAAWSMPPDVCFDEAHSIGLGNHLELLALERAAEYLPSVPGHLAMNVSPEALLAPECGLLLDRLPLDRVVLELSEHDAVSDYGLLMSVLAPRRARGMQLAIDDVGAGFSSLRHIVLTAPDVIKLDRTIVTGIGTDAVLGTLVNALVGFAHECRARVVAEGVETASDAEVLRGLGVDHGQGWFFGRPGPVEALSAAVRVLVEPPS
jgi:EAL domain-containing protein (putative c-di-GMP-specific phosphodiesterase class I)